MTSADPDPVRRLDVIERDVERCLLRLNRVEAKTEMMECHNEVQEKRVSELRCLHADEIRKGS